MRVLVDINQIFFDKKQKLINFLSQFLVNLLKEQNENLIYNTQIEIKNYINNLQKEQ